MVAADFSSLEPFLRKRFPKSFMRPPILNPKRDLVGATPEALARALFRRTEPLRPSGRTEAVVGNKGAVEKVAPDQPGSGVAHLRKRS